MAGGRPLKFPSLDDLKIKIDAYFQKCDISEEPYTITGLALALNTSRETLLNYEEREEYFDTIKEAKLRVQNYAEKKLFTSTPTGPIFALKNFGWTDKTQQEIMGKDGGAIKTETVLPDSDRDIINRYLQQKGATNDKQ